MAVCSTRDLRVAFLRRRASVERSVPDTTPSRQHQAADEVVDFVLDEARARAQMHRLRQAGFVARRFLIEPGVQRAAPDVQSSGGFADGDDPQRRRSDRRFGLDIQPYGLNGRNDRRRVTGLGFHGHRQLENWMRKLRGAGEDAETCYLI